MLTSTLLPKLLKTLILFESKTVATIKGENFLEKLIYVFLV